MASYYYVKDPSSEFGYTPIPEEEYVAAISRIAKKHGGEISDKLILGELEKMSKSPSKEKVVMSGKY